MSRSTNEIVAEIKTLYGRRHEEKLQIQRDMIVLRDEHGWSHEEIAEATEIPRRTVSSWIEAYDEALGNLAEPSRLTPQSVQDASDARVAARVLAKAPMETVERLIALVPKERQKQVAAAAGHTYLKARVEHEERERNLTPADLKAREANRSTIDDFAGKIKAPFITASIVLHIEQATEMLREVNGSNSMTYELEKEIAAALVELNQEFQVASAMAGSWSEEES